MNVLLAIRMEVDTIDGTSHLIETYIIESFETCAADFAYTVVWNQELLFPTHEHVLAITTVFVVKIWFLGLFGKRPPGRETCPMFHVFFITCTPIAVSSLEGILGTDNFTFKESGQGSMFRCQPYYR